MGRFRPGDPIGKGLNVNLLDRKGIITKQELLEEIKKGHATLPRSERDSQNL